MGHRHSRHTHQVVHYAPPAVTAQIVTLQQEVKTLQAKYENPEQFHKAVIKLQNLYVQNITKMNFTNPLTQHQKSKKNFCMIGPTSTGKSTLGNALFQSNGKVGLGSTTKEAIVIKQFVDRAFWDAPGINDDFGFYQDKHLGFFKSLDTVIILFDRDIDDVHLIIQVLSKLVPNRIYIRTKCDLWVSGMKPIQEQLKIDVAEIKKYDMQCKEVIPVGFGMYGKIKQILNL